MCIHNSDNGNNDELTQSNLRARRVKAVVPAALQPSITLEDGSGAHPSLYTHSVMAAQAAAQFTPEAQAHAKSQRAGGTPSAKQEGRSILARTHLAPNAQTFNIAQQTDHTPMQRPSSSSMVQSAGAVSGAQQRQRIVHRQHAVGGASASFIHDPAPYTAPRSAAVVHKPSPSVVQPTRHLTPRTSRITQSSIQLG